MNTTTAKDERSGREIKLTDGLFIANVSTGEWQFADTSGEEDDYAVVFTEDFLDSPASFVSSMANLSREHWFDAEKFFDFFERFQEENKINIS